MSFIIDGTDTGTGINAATSVVTSGITTAHAGDVLILNIFLRGGAAPASVSAVSTSGVTWSQVTRFVTGDGFTSAIEVWEGKALGTLSSAATTLTINTTGALYDCLSVSIIAVNGAGATLDPNASLPATSVYNFGASSPATVSTSNAVDLLVDCAGEAANHDLGTDTITQSFTGQVHQLTNNSNSASTAIATLAVSATQSGVAVNPYSSQPNQVVIALQAGSIAGGARSQVIFI